MQHLLLVNPVLWRFDTTRYPEGEAIQDTVQLLINLYYRDLTQHTIMREWLFIQCKHWLILYYGDLTQHVCYPEVEAFDTAEMLVSPVL